MLAIANVGIKDPGGPEQAQNDIIEELAKSAEEYTALFDAITELELEQTRLQKLLENLENNPSDVHDYAEVVRNIVPSAEPNINDIIEELTQSEKESLLQAFDDVTLQLKALHKLRDIASQAWPVPMAKYRYPLLAMIKVVDTYPGEPLQPSVSARPCKPKERHEVMQGASLRLAELLIENEGLSLLPEQLGKLLYRDVNLDDKPYVERELYYRDNVHRLLVPSAHLTNNELQKHGYTLQRGWRIYLSTTDGKRLQQARRVYKVVPTPEANGKTIYSEEILDSSELPMVISKPRNKRPTTPTTETNSEIETDKDEIFRQDVICAIEVLATNGLLPPLDKIYSKKPLSQLKLDIFNKFGPKARKIKDKHIRSLFHNVVNDNDGYDALSIVGCSLTSEWLSVKKCKSTKDYDHLMGIIELELISYYESLATKNNPDTII